jgi:alkyl hydroperoxide reductase subunit AhpF
MNPKMLNDEIIRQINEVFETLSHPVAVLFFSKKADCEYCEDTRQLLEEVCQLSDQLHLSVYDLDADAALAQQYHVDNAPGIVLAGWDDGQITDYGIRFAGIPAGSEFTSLINSLVMISNRSSGLSQVTRDFISKLTQPVSMQVFVTPT